MPGRQGMPDTIKRSSTKAQRTWQETRDNAIDEYGDGRRAHQTAYAALKHSFEKVGDHWEAKGQSKAALLERARALGVKGRSRMTKEELADAIAKEQ